MPIREEAFRIGCGRYLQKSGAINALGEEVRRLGASPLILGGKTALKLTREAIEKSVAGSCPRYEIIEHRKTCNEGFAKDLADKARSKGFDVIVGVGGGVMMDFAKLVADLAKLPVINVPTSTATCAAYTPLSVCYTPEGRTVGTRHFGKEVDAVLVDTAVIAGQPVRLLLAGIFDALAKFVEIKHRFSEETEEYPLGLDWAYLLAQRSFQQLNRLTERCIADMEAGYCSDAVEQVAFTAIAVTGVISGIARGSNQTALAHKFYETTRSLFHGMAKPYLHGEIVGVGLLLQNHFNGEEEKNTFLLQLMKKYGMPCTVAAVGVDGSEAAFNEYYYRICHSSALDPENREECEKFKESLRYLWKLKGE